MPARLTCALAAALLLLALAACGHDPALPGSYAGTTPEGPVALELKDGGKGSWSTPEEDIAVTWERRGDEVWLHTRSGGVVICAIRSGGGLEADIPGVGRIVLERKRP